MQGIASKETEPVLVTGASGLLGCAFVAQAAQELSLVACHGRHPLNWPGVRSCSVDFRDHAQTTEVLERFSPRVIVHLAAETNLDRCARAPDEAMEFNAGLTGRLANWAAAHQSLLVYMSTDSVFDGGRGRYTEDDEPSPVNVYASSKLAGERAVQASGAAHLIVRANIFGWNAQNKLGLAEWALAELQGQRPIVGFTDVVFNPLHVSTLSAMILGLLRKGARGLFHLGSSRPVSKYEFISLLAKEFGLGVACLSPRSISTMPMQVRRPLDTSLDCRKLERLQGMQAPLIEQEISNLHAQQLSGFAAALKSSIALS